MPQAITCLAWIMSKGRKKCVANHDLRLFGIKNMRLKLTVPQIQTRGKVFDLANSTLTETKNLQTRGRQLYVCDASIIPETWGLPPSLTIMCLAKRLAGHLA